MLTSPQKPRFRMINCKKTTWLISGIITGFTLGFLYFAIGVYTHSQNRNSLSISNINPDYKHAGITR